MRIRFLLCCVAAASLVSGASAAPPKFRTVEVKVPKLQQFPGCEPTSMNNRGEITGLCDSNSAYDAQPYYWDADHNPHAIPLIGGSTSLMTPNSINDHGEIVGLVQPDRRSRYGFVFSPSKGTRAVGRDSYYSEASGINNAGTAVGVFTPRGARTRAPRAVSWTADSGQQDLVAFPMDGAKRTAAVAINDRGQVLIRVNELLGQQTTALLEPDGTYRVLPGKASEGTVVGLALSSNGLVAGRRYAPNQHAFLWEGGDVVDIGTLSGKNPSLMSIAYGVNSAGQVVGYSDVVIGQNATKGAAFYYDKTNGMHNLEDLIDPSDPLAGKLSFDNAVAINDAGWIVVSAAKKGDFLWGGRPVILVPASP